MDDRYESFRYLLPHRARLISSIHLVNDFAPYPLRREPGFAPIYRPSNTDLEAWETCCRTLNTLPRLRSLSIVQPSEHMDLRGWVAGPTTDMSTRIFTLLNPVHVSGHFSISFPWPAHLDMTPQQLSRFHASSGPAFTLSAAACTPRDKMALLVFFLPLDIQCLHCRPPATIRKLTGGGAESILSRAVSHRGLDATDPVETRYWTSHTACGGWMELEYDWEGDAWGVTQGARALARGEVEALAPVLGQGVEDGSAHERLQGVRMLGHPREVAVFDTGGKVMDAPTKEAYYRNVGWSSSSPRD